MNFFFGLGQVAAMIMNMGMMSSNQICRKSPPHFLLILLCQTCVLQVIVIVKSLRLNLSNLLQQEPVFLFRQRPLSFAVCYRSTLLGILSCHVMSCHVQCVEVGGIGKAWYGRLMYVVLNIMFGNEITTMDRRCQV